MNGMKWTPRRWVRDLAPIPISPTRELRLQLVEVNGHERIAMAVYAKGDKDWVRVAAEEVPVRYQIPTVLPENVEEALVGLGFIFSDDGQARRRTVHLE